MANEGCPEQNAFFRKKIGHSVHILLNFFDRMKNTKFKHKNLAPYHHENLISAAKEVNSGRLNRKKAAKKFSVSRMTLYSALKLNVEISARPGPSTVLAEYQDFFVVERLLPAAKLGWCLNTKELLEQEQKITAFKSIPFRNGLPGSQ